MDNTLAAIGHILLFISALLPVFWLRPLHLKACRNHLELKTPRLDPDSPNNYWPISNLPFLSKVLERVDATQLKLHLDSNELYEPSSSYQTGQRQLPSWLLINVSAPAVLPLMTLLMIMPMLTLIALRVLLLCLFCVV